MLDTLDHRIKISTHAPRTGSDQVFDNAWVQDVAFQPTLPARGATNCCLIMRATSFAFQPTLPARGATF